MEHISQRKDIPNFYDIEGKTSRDIRTKYFLPFSPYQITLFLFDILFFISSLYFVFFKYLSSLESYSLKDLITVFILVVPALSFFPIYKLYSYHIIFRKKLHIQYILKSYCWALFCFYVIYFLYDWPFLFSHHGLYNGALILAAAFLIAILGRFFADYLTHLLMAIGTAFVTVGALGLILDNKPPIFIESFLTTAKAVLASLLFVAIGRYFIVHTVYNNWLRRYFRKQMIILGENGIATEITKHIVKYNAPFWINGTITLKKKPNDIKKVNSGNLFINKKNLGTIYDLPKIVKEHDVQEIIITDQSIDKKQLITVLDFAVSNGIVAWFPPSLLPIIPMKLNIDDFCGLPMIRMCLQRNPAFFKIFKRSMDLVLSSTLVLILAPVLSAIAISIKMDSKGPIFYRAEVVGKNGRRFKMFKFRSMRIDGDHSIHKDFVTKFIKGEINREKSSVLKITDDPRVTRVGKIIRRLSLDELPQLFNVLKGDMSLVGPRPCLPYEYELYKDWHRKRNSIRPGITGLWQIAGRSEVSFEEMILLDLYYIYNRNLMMDFSILFETIFVVFGMEGAY